MTFDIRFDEALVRRYDGTGPRYTSYPTAVQFHEGVGPAEVAAAATRSNGDPIPTPLSLYVHVPFCASPCFYCACNKVITRDPHKADDYLDRLEKEVRMQAAMFDRDRVVDQLHFGGGTPTFLDRAQMGRLMDMLEQNFNLRDDDSREFGIEIDPRTVSRETVRYLAAMGFNRMSIGIQDFDPAVQKAVNRVQSREDVEEIMDEGRRCGFDSISVDLIYGLPLQTPVSFGRTLDVIEELRPDRLSVYSYAHLPHLFKPQKRIRAADVPSPETKLALMRLTIERLTSAGYRYVGMDHFALPDDELVRAQEKGELQRNFQGYSTHANCDLVGLGVSAIGSVSNVYAQNAKTLAEYYALLDQARLPTQRGVVLSEDDLLRRDIIQQIMCHGVVRPRDVETRYGLSFRKYFAAELADLEPLARDSLVELDPFEIRVTPVGRLLVRAVAKVFDAHLRETERRADTPKFSRII